MPKVRVKEVYWLNDPPKMVYRSIFFTPSKEAGKTLCAINKIENITMIHPVIDKLLLGADNII